MAKSEQKLKALALRRKGESIKSIAQSLGVSKSAVSLWVRDISLTKKQKEALYARQILAGHKGRLLGAQWNKDQKNRRIQRAEQDSERRIRKLLAHHLFFLGLGLYWGEGTKASNGTVAIVNSDPRIIQIMIRWFEECWAVERSRLQPRIFISSTHRDREEIIYRFWVKTLGIPRQQFRRMIFLEKGKKIYENRNMYYGVLTLRIARGSELRHKILADIAQVAKIGIKAGVVQELERGTHKP